MDKKLKAISLIAEAVEVQKKAVEEAWKLLQEEGLTVLSIDCDPEDPRVHIYEGIEQVAVDFDKPIEKVPRMDQYKTWCFEINGVKVFQLVDAYKDDLTEDE